MPDNRKYAILKLILLFPFCVIAECVFAHSDIRLIDYVGSRDEIAFAADDIKTLCGANCVYTAVRMLSPESRVGYFDIYKRLYPEDDFRVSVSDISKALDYYRIKNTVVSLGRDEIFSCPGTAFIVYQAPEFKSGIGHFYIVKVSKTGKSSVIIDPPYVPESIMKDDFDDSKRYTVIALGDSFAMPRTYYWQIVAGVVLTAGPVGAAVLAMFFRGR